MLKLENTEVFGWEAAIRGMRNPKNSWDRGDSKFCVENCDDCDNFSTCQSIHNKLWFKKFYEGSGIATNFCIGPNDHMLMTALAKNGPVHAKYRRMITVYVDITAPLYWWKEFDTYKVGTVANSCSTMHKIAAREFTLDDFSNEHLVPCSYECLKLTIKTLNNFRDCFIYYNDVVYKKTQIADEIKPIIEKYSKKDIWWQMIQLLPSSYNQRRTIMLNYEVLANIYPMRKNHKLDEWHTFCDWIKSLPYSELITFEKDESV